MGVRAEAQAQSRYEQPAVEREPRRGSSELGVLMVDGCQLRYRGPGWGKKKTQKDRVEWHELKLGVFYRHEASAHTETGRGLLIDKLVVNWQDQAGELGRRLNWEAMREGLGRAKETLYLGDGAEWVWNLKQDRWKAAVELLDFYHGSEHLWSLGRALHGEKEPALSQWVEPLRHQVRHGQEQRALRQIGQLKTARWNEQEDSPRTELLRNAFRSDELPTDRKTWVAHWLRGRRIGLSPEAMPIQTLRPVLVQSRPA